MMNVVATDLRDLEARMMSRLGSEREALAGFLVLLGEFEERRGHEAMGFATVWDYCRRILRLSNAQIFYRSNAAGVVRRFPAAAARLADGRICMTALVKLRDVLTGENVEALLDRAEGKTKEEVEEIVVALRPRAVSEKTVIQREPSIREVRELPGTMALPSPPEAPPSADVPVAAPPVAARAEEPVRIEPVAAGRYRLHMTVDAEFVEALHRATEALRHAVPHGDPREILARGLKLLLEKAAKRSDVAAVKPRRPTAPADESKRYVPAALERAVRTRDGNRCVFPTVAGPCRSTHLLEIDHVVPVARGGPTTLENLRLVCRAHNQLHAREDFGRELVEEKIRAARRRHVH